MVPDGNGNAPSTTVPTMQNRSNPPTEELANPQSVSQIRRRLSVDGNHLDIDGVEEMDIEVDNPDSSDANDESFMGVYAGVSNKGYVPYNPRKVNQDSLLIREDSITKTLVLGAFERLAVFQGFIPKSCLSLYKKALCRQTSNFCFPYSDMFEF